MRLLLVFWFFFGVSTGAAQQGATTLGAGGKAMTRVNPAMVQQHQRALDDVCVQHGLIKKNLRAPALRRAAPAVAAVREFRNEHSGEPGTLDCARTEVRKVFGNRPPIVEDILVCYVFGEAMGCSDIAEMRRRVQFEQAQAAVANAKDATAQGQEEMHMMMALVKKLQDEKARLAGLCAGI